MDTETPMARTLNKGEFTPLSSLYTMLPDMLQRRVVRFPSLRRTASTYASSRPSIHRRAWSAGSDMESSGSITPPPSYQEPDDRPRLNPFPQYNLSSGRRPAPHDLADDRDDGIQWDYARQGIFILSQAIQDLTTEAGNRRLGQQLYVDGMKYCLQGLPEDLTSAQLASLRSAMPSAMLPDESQELVSLDAERRGSESTVLRPESLLHFVTAKSMTWACIMVAFVLPFLQLVVLACYRFERRHRLSDRVLVKGYTTAETLSRVSMNCVNQVLSMNDGRFKALLVAAVLYCMREASDGMHAGLSEGLQRAGVSVDVDRRDHSWPPSCAYWSRLAPLVSQLPNFGKGPAIFPVDRGIWFDRVSDGSSFMAPKSSYGDTSHCPFLVPRLYCQARAYIFS
nr:hypothetical protein CFP56_28809 [Quercus suber]